MRVSPPTAAQKLDRLNKEIKDSFWYILSKNQVFFEKIGIYTARACYLTNPCT